jgi:hypothetical protein
MADRGLNALAALASTVFEPTKMSHGLAESVVDAISVAVFAAAVVVALRRDAKTVLRASDERPRGKFLCKLVRTAGWRRRDDRKP